MKSDEFQKMCEILEPNKLVQQTRGDGKKLLESFSLNLDGKLKANPEGNDLINKGPEKDAVEKGLPIA